MNYSTELKTINGQEVLVKVYKETKKRTKNFLYVKKYKPQSVNSLMKLGLWRKEEEEEKEEDNQSTKSSLA